ncbi:hypothetical protein [uncultured Dokdonia sp.]|uniref:hypothetical protein n=1 Tax=uncultured Dokdonia sp. TaxID=575653 RepID=UPI002616614E|nr:hypothetical protein [uncultured Dokdonia sp.]
MDEYRKKLNDSFKNGIYGNEKNKEKYLNGLKVIRAEHKSFFENKPDGKNQIEDYVVPNNFTGKPLLGLNYQSELTPKLKSDLIELWESIFLDIDE